jgi:hypothetical protein
MVQRSSATAAGKCPRAPLSRPRTGDHHRTGSSGHPPAEAPLWGRSAPVTAVMIISASRRVGRHPVALTARPGPGTRWTISLSGWPPSWASSRPVATWTAAARSSTAAPGPLSTGHRPAAPLRAPRRPGAPGVRGRRPDRDQRRAGAGRGWWPAAAARRWDRGPASPRTRLSYRKKSSDCARDPVGDPVLQERECGPPTRVPPPPAAAAVIPPTPWCGRPAVVGERPDRAPFAQAGPR